ncbi:hypothetical protein DICPUDRAFT_22581, partial [Dictyostelium purpureum]
SEEVSKDFDAKPQGNLETVDMSLGDYKCEFSYVSTGGSNEQWVIHINDNSDHVVCIIGRPNPPKSYLLFHDFTATLTNTKTGKLSSPLNVEVYDNEGTTLMNDQFKVIENKVVPDKNFGKNIVLVQL